MPAPISPLNQDQIDAILDGEGHESCPGVVLRSDVEIRPATAEAPRQYAAIYEPEARVAALSPGLLVFHGGGFNGGNPHGPGALAKMLALTLGVVTVSASYRTGTAEKPTGPAILDDAANAWAWVHAHAADLGIDPLRIAVGGHSAGVLLGGHLAVRSPLVTAAQGISELPAPAAFYACWGPVDFVARWYDNGENPGAEVNILGPGGFPAHPSGYHQLSVLAHARGALPPALFIYGRTDTVVHPRQGALGTAAWLASGSFAESFTLPNIGHAIVGDNRDQRRQYLEKSVKFASWRHLGPS